MKGLADNGEKVSSIDEVIAPIRMVSLVDCSRHEVGKSWPSCRRVRHTERSMRTRPLIKVIFLSGGFRNYKVDKKRVLCGYSSAIVFPMLGEQYFIFCDFLGFVSNKT